MVRYGKIFAVFLLYTYLMYMCMNTYVNTDTYPPTLPISTHVFFFYKSIPILPTNKVNNTRLENPEPRRRSEC